ncbi:MAG TPA: type II toxin-antitoxin system VapC family toxin [Tepidisphaeraceae bacterium]
MGNSGKKVPRLYWDACVFLSFIEDHPGRAPVIESLLEDCEQGKFEIWTSHMSIVEVAFAKTEKDGKALDAEVEKEIDSLWHPSSPIKLVEVSELICTGARTLVREGIEKQHSVRSADAVHLATAQLVDVDEFCTYDQRLLGANKLVTFKLCEPSVSQLLIAQEIHAKQKDSSQEKK